MGSGVTLGGWSVPRLLSGVAGAGMTLSAAISVQVYYGTRYPAVVAAGEWCGGGPLFGCDAAVLSAVGSPLGLPLGVAGLVLGASLVLGALLPSLLLERTNRALLMVNAVAVTALFFYATLVLQTLCLLCTVYGAFSLAGAGLFFLVRDREPGAAFAPAPVHLGVAGAVLAAGWLGVGRYAEAVRTADDTLTGMRAVAHFYSLPQVPWPSEISPFRAYSAAPEFDAAAIRIVEYADPLCVDCRVLHEQLRQLESEFAGQVTLAYQFFPLEAACNDVVDKDKHPGSCELAYMLAADPARFRVLLDEVVDNMDAAKGREWQQEFARRHRLEEARTDPLLQDLVHRLIRTGTEYDQTSDRFAYGIRSTPTMIINNRMIIGTMPTDQLRAIFRALVDEHRHGGARFMEGWLEPGCVIAAPGETPKPCGT
jgi:uncharacterized membrane protein/protein-disulfide isomerase